MEKTKTTVNRSLNLTEELRAEIKQAARAVGMSQAAFIRLAARNAADQVLTTGCSVDEILSIEKNARLPRWMREIRDILNTVGNEGAPERSPVRGDR
jgi:coenzyme F420-reducing hydrogenase delta subunit